MSISRLFFRLVCSFSLVAAFLTPIATTFAADLKSSADREGEGRYVIGPEYKLDPDLQDKGNPKGKKFQFTMRLADSKIFPGTDKTLEPENKPVRKERKIFVYVPAGYQDGTKAPVL